MPKYSGPRAPAHAKANSGAGGCLSVGLMVVGGLWALVGLGNMIVGFGNIVDSGGGEGWATANLMINMLLFIIPGLIVAGIGQMLRKR